MKRCGWSTHQLRVCKGQRQIIVALSNRSGPVLAVRTGLGTTCSHLWRVRPKGACRKSVIGFLRWIHYYSQARFFGESGLSSQMCVEVWRTLHLGWRLQMQAQFSDIEGKFVKFWSQCRAVQNVRCVDEPGTYRPFNKTWSLCYVLRVCAYRAANSTILYWVYLLAWPFLMKRWNCQVQKYISVSMFLFFFHHIVTLFWYLACCNIWDPTEARMPLGWAFWMLHNIMAGAYEEVKFFEYCFSWSIGLL